MQFQYPGFLSAFLVLLIPIIIHLFNFRRYKKVYFSNVSLLREVKEETRKQSKLRHLLVLLSRLLLLSCLVLAFARPYFPVKGQKQRQGQKFACIYIDNSFQSALNGRNGNLLEQARMAAKEIVQAYAPSDRFQILTNDFEGRHQHWVNRDIFLQQLTEIKISPAQRTLNDILVRQKEILKTAEGVKQAYVLSAVNENGFNPAAFTNDTTIRYYLAPLQVNETGNVFIDTAWFTDPVRRTNKQEELSVRVTNHRSSALEDLPVTLFVNGTQKSMATVSMPAGESKNIVLGYRNPASGVQQVEVKIDDYPLTHDNSWYISYKLNKYIPVLHIRGKNAGNAVRKVLQADSVFKVNEVESGNIPFGQFSSYQLIIAEEPDQYSSGFIDELKKSVLTGKTVCLIPSSESGQNSDVAELNQLFGLSIGRIDSNKVGGGQINIKHPLFQSVFDESKLKKGRMNLPGARRHFPIRFSEPGEEKLISLANGEALFSLLHAGKGRLFVISAPLREKFSDFQNHALFVPSVLQMAGSSAGISVYSGTPGKSGSILISENEAGADETVKLVSSDNTENYIVPLKSDGFNTTAIAGNQVKKAGHFILSSSNGDTLMPVSFNYNRYTSAGKILEIEEVKDKLAKTNLFNFTLLEKTEKNMGGVIKELNRGTELWKYFVVGTLIFLALEIILIRFVNQTRYV